jgi:hypothetical protein
MTSHFKSQIAPRQWGEALRKGEERLRNKTYMVTTQPSTLVKRLHIITAQSKASDSAPWMLLVEG